MTIVGAKIGMKKLKAKKKKEKFWKKIILSDTNKLKTDLSSVEGWFALWWKKDTTKGEKALDQKYRLKRKSFLLIMEGLKQKITAQATKVKWYGNRTLIR